MTTIGSNEEQTSLFPATNDMTMNSSVVDADDDNEIGVNKDIVEEEEDEQVFDNFDQLHTTRSGSSIFQEMYESAKAMSSEIEIHSDEEMKN